MVENWAKSNGFERFVVLTCDYEVRVQGVLEANHCSSSELGVYGVERFDFLQVEWPLVFDEKRPFLLEFMFGEGKFVVSEPVCDGSLSMVGVCGLSGVERGLGIASCYLLECGIQRQKRYGRCDVALVVGYVWILLEPLLT